jgi:hypothetical protein
MCEEYSATHPLALALSRQRERVNEPRITQTGPVRLSRGSLDALLEIVGVKLLSLNGE